VSVSTLRPVVDRRDGPPAPPAVVPRRSLALVVPTVAAGVAAVTFAAASLALAVPPSPRLLGFVALLVAGCVCEAFPAPVARGGGNLSLGAIVVIATAVMYGPAEAALVGGIARALDDGVRRRPQVRMAFNGSVYAVGGLLAGAAAGLVPGVAAQTLAATCVFYALLVVLISAIVGLTTGAGFVRTAVGAVRDTAPSFAFMSSVALILAVLWRDSPLFAAALLGPLLATALHQRAAQRTIEAMRLALTDPLTGLGNLRAFQERLRGELDRADDDLVPVSLCLLDLDDFKLVNDTYGHAAGDEVLAAVGACLRHGGEAFRLGGDEFALVLPRLDGRDAAHAARSVLHRLGDLRPHPGGAISFSAGLATYPADAPDLTELQRVADVALYRAKRRGKNQLEVASGPTTPLAA
jgi:diguanylate cyclase (GGDEF)-like protein